MEYAHLLSFIAVAEQLHFSRAARQRHLSQPALSKQVQQLESELGVLLFERNRRVVRLTSAGELLLLRARCAVAAVEDVANAAGRLRRNELGRLCVGFTPTAPHGVLPALVRAFRSQYPRLALELHEASSQEQKVELLRGTLDVGLLRTDATLAESIRIHRRFPEPFVIALAKDHPLARKQSLGLKQLSAHAWIAVKRDISPSVHDAISAAWQSAGVTPPAIHYVSQVHAALALVGAGYGVAIVPGSVRHLRLREVAFVTLRERLTSTLVVAHAREHSSPALQAFLAVSARIPHTT